MTSPDRRTTSILLTILLFALALAIVYVARSVIIIFAFSILFAYLINPIVRFLQRHSLFFKNLRGPHVLEAYLAIVVLTALCSHGFFPDFRRNAGQLLKEIPVLTDRVSSGEIASELGSNLGWADEQTDRIRTFFQRHRSYRDLSFRAARSRVACHLPKVCVAVNGHATSRLLCGLSGNET